MAQPQPDSNDGQSNKPQEQEDRDFDPSAQALIDDIDDERTLEEEEALDANSGAAVQDELDDLKRESEMPIEELLAYYERMRQESGEGDGDDDHDDDDDGHNHDHDDENDAHVDGNDNEEEEAPSGQQERLIDEHGDNRPIENKSNSQNQAEANPPVKETNNNHEPQHEDALQPARSSDSNNHSTINSLQQQQEKIACGVSSSDEHTNLINSESEITSNQEIEPKEIEVSSEEKSDSVTTPDRSRHHRQTDFMIDDENGVFKTLLGYDLEDSDDMDEDYSYSDDEYADDDRDWRRSIHVGPDHQADVSDSLSKYDGLPPYENKDTLVWKCPVDLSRERIIRYLKEASALSRTDVSTSPASVPKISADGLRIYRERMNDISSSSGPQVIEHEHENLTSFVSDTYPNLYMKQSRKGTIIDYQLEQEIALDGVNQVCMMSQSQLVASSQDNSSSTSQDTKQELSTEEYFQDEEQLLYLLLQCNYNFDEAMRRRKLDPFKYYLHEPMSLWSQEECLSFEDGLRTYGKDFRLIRENKVQTRTHAEVVAFYYLWKKSERHDMYINQYKLDRKRSASHPGTTDYMDRFIEDNESITNASSSPTPTPIEVRVGTLSTMMPSRDSDQPISTSHGPERSLPNGCNDISNDFTGSTKLSTQIDLPLGENTSDQADAVHIDSETHI